MTISFAVAGPADAEDVYDVTKQAFTGTPPLDPPSGAVSETVDQVAADLAATGGVIARDRDRPIASLRFRTDDEAVWLRRVGVVPELQRHSVGTRMVAFAHAVLAKGGVGQLRVGVRHARPGSRRFWVGLGYADAVEHDYWVEMHRAPAVVVPVPTADDMRALGRRLADVVGPGDVVVCVGGLGAGKTTLAQGVGAGLGVEGAVVSPTFVLAREHRPGASGVPFVHVDAYRLGAVPDPLAEVDALDLDATLDTAVTFVEWGEGLVERLAVNRIEVRIDVDPATEERSVVVDALGPRWAGVDLGALAAAEVHGRAP